MPPSRKSYGGGNAYTFWCEETDQSGIYGICQIIIENVAARQMMPASADKCAEKIKAGLCPALKMIAQEDAGEAEYYEPWPPPPGSGKTIVHEQPRFVNPERFSRSLERFMAKIRREREERGEKDLEPKPLRGGVPPSGDRKSRKVWSEPVLPPTKDVIAPINPDLADVINAAIARESAAKPETAPEKKAAPSERPSASGSPPKQTSGSLLEIARRMKEGKGS